MLAVGRLSWRMDESDGDLIRNMTSPSVASPLCSSSASCNEPDLSSSDPGEQAKQLRQRKAVLKELIDTENGYCQDLDTLHQVFMLPLQFRQKEIGISKADIDILFSNLEILISLNKQVMGDLAALPKDAEGNTEMQGVGMVFKKMTPYFKMYTQYSANQPQALAHLEQLSRTNTKFNDCLQISTKDPRCRGLMFGSYLIKPVQRICKYPLLMRELLRYVDESHPDQPLIKAAKDEIDKVVDAINEGKRTVETQTRVFQLASQLEGLDFDLVTPSRKHIRDSTVMLTHVIEKAGSERHLFLFNDLVLLGRQISARPSYKVDVAMPFGDIRFIVIPDQEKISNAFELLFRSTRYIIALPSPKEQQEWVSDFKTLTRQLKLAQLQAAKKSQAAQSAPVSP